MVEIVNGYACANCKDVSYAKRGLDPRNPTHDPVRQQRIDSTTSSGSATAAFGSAEPDAALGRDAVRAAPATGQATAERRLDRYV